MNLVCKLALSLCLLSPLTVSAQTPGTLKSYYRIDVAPGTTLADSLANWWYRGGAGACMIPDVDGDGIQEVMITSRTFDDDLLLHQLRMNANGTVKKGPPNTDMQRVPTSNWYTGANFDVAGTRGSLTQIGDINGDGVIDLAMGNSFGDARRGEFFIVLMNASGRVDSLKQIKSNFGGLNVTLAPNGSWGNPLASLGDIDGDGIPDMATSQSTVDSGRGVLWIVNLTRQGTVKSWKTIQNGSANLPVINRQTSLGNNLAGLGDLDLDGVPDMMVTSIDSDQVGSVWILFLNSDGTVKRTVRHRPNTPTFPVSINPGAFGTSVATIGDIDGDSVVDVVVSDPSYPDLSTAYGRLYILMLNRDGSIKATQHIDKNNSNLGNLADKTSFGYVVFPMGDFNKDGIPDVGVGMPEDDAAMPSNSGRNSGGFYILNLNGVPIRTSVGDVISNTTKDYFVYPNPTSDKLTIRNHEGVTGKIESVRIVNSAGRVVRLITVNSSTAIIDIQSLSSGTYFLQIGRAGIIQSAQFLKN